MTTTIDDLVPEQLWQAIQPLLPTPPPRHVAVPASMIARRWPASSTSCAPGCPGGCCRPGSSAAAARSPAGGGGATGNAPASGNGCTTCCWTSSAAKASSTGRGRAWTRRACAPNGGRADRPEPDRPRQARVEVPPAGRPPWPSLGRLPVSRQHPRLTATGAAGRRRPAGQGPAWPTRAAAPAARQAPLGQGLRLPALPAGAAPTRHHAQNA